VRRTCPPLGLILAPTTFVLMLGFSFVDLRDGAHDASQRSRAPVPTHPGIGRVGGGRLVDARTPRGLAFVATALVIVILFVTLFLNLYPRVLVSR